MATSCHHEKLIHVIAIPNCNLTWVGNYYSRCIGSGSMGPIQRQIMVLVDCFDSLNQFAEIVEWTIQARNGGREWRLCTLNTLVKNKTKTRKRYENSCMEMSIVVFLIFECVSGRAHSLWKTVQDDLSAGKTSPYIFSSFLLSIHRRPIQLPTYHDDNIHVTFRKFSIPEPPFPILHSEAFILDSPLQLRSQ